MGSIIKCSHCRKIDMQKKQLEELDRHRDRGTSIGNRGAVEWVDIKAQEVLREYANELTHGVCQCVTVEQLGLGLPVE